MFAAGAERQAWNGFVRLSGMRLLEYLNQVTDELRRHWEDTRYLLPTLKPLMHYLMIVRSRELMLLGVEVLANQLKRCQESLSLSGRLKALHSALS